MYDRLTDRARRVMQYANEEAMSVGHEYIGTEDIILGLVREGVGAFAHVLKSLKVDISKIRGEVEKALRLETDVTELGDAPTSPRAKKVIEYAMEESKNLNHSYVGTEHLLLGLLRDHNGVAAQVLMNLGVTLETARGEVINVMGMGISLHPTKPGDGILRSAGALADMPEMDEIFDEIERERKAARFRDETP